MPPPVATLEIQLLADMARLQKDMRDVQRLVKHSMDNVANDVGVAERALSSVGGGINKAGGSAKLASHHVQNLAFQFQDLGVQLASGANPLTAFVQQGSQIAGVMSQAGIGVKGLALAILDMAKASAMAVVSNPVLLAVAAAAAAAYGAFKLFQSSVASTGELDAYTASLGLTKKELEELGPVGVSFGDVIQGIWKTISDGLGLEGVWTSMKAWAVDMFATTLDWSKKAVAGIYGGFVAAYDGIRSLWDNFPAVMGDIAISAANRVLAAVMALANHTIDAINRLSAGASAAAKAMGIDVNIGQLNHLPTAKISNPYAGAGKSAAAAFSGGFERGMQDAMGGMDSLGRTLRDNIVGAAKDRIRAEADALIAKRSEKAAKADRDAKKARDDAEREADQRAYDNARRMVDIYERLGKANIINKDMLTSGVKEVDRILKLGAKEAAETFRNDGIEAAQAIGQVLGGSLGNTVAQLLGLVQGMSSGNFNSVGGKAGGLLTLLSGGKGKQNSAFFDGMREIFDPMKKSIKSLGKGIGESFGIRGSMSKTLGKMGAGAAVGTAVAGIGKALGLKMSSTGSQIGGAIGAALPIPGGALIGSVLGGTIGGLFKKKPYGTANITSVDQDAAIRGNKSSVRAAAGASASSVQDGLRAIAEQFGADLGNFNVSIGQYKGKWRVSTSGYTGKLNGNAPGGVKDFGKDGAEEAVKYAIADAIRDGALLGLRTATQRLLKGSGDLDAQLDKALRFENVFRELKQRTDPVGAAIEDLNKQFESLKKVFAEAQASTAEWADLEKLYQLKRTDIIEQGNNAAVKTMKDYLSELTGGSSSPLSSQIRYANSVAQLAQLDAKRAVGGAVDFETYRAAADQFLAASRDYNGSSTAFFRDFERITSTVQGLISAQENAATAPQASVDFTPVVAAVSQQTTVQTQLLQRIAEALEKNKPAGSTAANGNDVAAAISNSLRYYRSF